MQGKLGDAPDSVIQTGFLELSSFGATLDSEKCHVLSIVKFRSIAEGKVVIYDCIKASERF